MVENNSTNASGESFDALRNTFSEISTRIEWWVDDRELWRWRNLFETNLFHIFSPIQVPGTLEIFDQFCLAISELYLKKKVNQIWKTVW